MKPRLGKKGRKALAAKKAAKPTKKKAAKRAVPAPAPEPQEAPAPQEQAAPEAPQEQAPEESGVGDGCAVGGSGDGAGPESNPA